MPEMLVTLFHVSREANEPVNGREEDVPGQRDGIVHLRLLFLYGLDPRSLVEWGKVPLSPNQCRQVFGITKPTWERSRDLLVD